MAGFDAAHGYTTRELVKENAWERTELVEDAAGGLYVRKYLQVDPDDPGPHPYERIAGLACPYLPHVVSAVRYGDTLVVICDWVEGEDLGALYRERGRLSRDEVARVFSDVCDAVSALHRAPGGPIVHRDVNPSNVIFDGEHAHLIDLGIARSWREGADADTHLWGTAGYAAPEQFGFGQSDARADVYALGKLFRFLLTGRHPDESAAGLLSERERLVVERACQVDPKDRYRDVGALLRAAERALREPNGPIAWHPHEHPVLWYAFCALAWAFVGFLVYGSVGTLVTGITPPTAGHVAAYFFLDVFVGFVPAVLLTGSFGVLERVAWFRESRRSRVAAAVLASVFFGLLGCGVFF